MPLKDPDARRAYARQWKAANREKVLERKREYRQRRPEVAKAHREATRDRSREVARAWRQNNRALHRERQKRHKFKRAYGITRAQRDAMFEAQGSCCAMCQTLEPGKNGWVTDHDHATGVVRGILCNRCNVSLGMAGDTLEAVQVWHERATRYLAKPRP